MTIIVTGAARGIGRGVVQTLLDAGHRVVAADLDVSPLADLHDRDLIIEEGDVTEPDFIDRICASAGPITGVFAGAGISRPGSSEDYPKRDWDAILALNLTAVFELMRTAAKTATDGASFVAISSVTASQGFAGRAAYAASKAGVDGLVRALAIEYAPRIRVNSIVSGFIMTDIARENIARGVIDDESIVGRTPLRRWGLPGDIASATEFLVSPNSSWITGASIPVDGGWLAFGLGPNAR